MTTSLKKSTAGIAYTLAEFEAHIANRPQRAGQLVRARVLIASHPDAVIIQVPDEHTGRAFGRRDCRRGLCEKIGGCRQPYYYQVWCSWAPCDMIRLETEAA